MGVPTNALITGEPIGKHLFLGTHLASLTHTSRAQGRKKKRTNRDSLLEEKGRADEESEDGHRHGPAFRYRGHPSKHTTNREHFFLTNPPTLLILTSCTYLSVQKAEKQFFFSN